MDLHQFRPSFVFPRDRRRRSRIIRRDAQTGPTERLVALLRRTGAGAGAAGRRTLIVTFAEKTISDATFRDRTENAVPIDFRQQKKSAQWYDSFRANHDVYWPGRTTREPGLLEASLVVTRAQQQRNMIVSDRVLPMDKLYCTPCPKTIRNFEICKLFHQKILNRFPLFVTQINPANFHGVDGTDKAKSF